MSPLKTLEAIVGETYNTEFRISFSTGEWKIYIVKSRTTFRGEFDEIINLAIEEFTSYRELSGQPPHVKHYKPYTYK